MYPLTYCGKSIAVITGLFGVFCTALLVAVVTKKLRFTTAEKYVYQFVNEIELYKELKHAAANIMKSSWFLYKLKKNDVKANQLEYIKKQRCLLVNVQKIRSLKQKQRDSFDNSITSIEVFRQNNDIGKDIATLNDSTAGLQSQINSIQNRINFIDEKLQAINDLLLRNLKK